MACFNILCRNLDWMRIIMDSPIEGSQLTGRDMKRSEIRDCEAGSGFWLQVNECRGNLTAWLKLRIHFIIVLISRLVFLPWYMYMDNPRSHSLVCSALTCLGHTLKGGDVASANTNTYLPQQHANIWRLLLSCHIKVTPYLLGKPVATK
jgi:hypothetical protein